MYRFSSPLICRVGKYMPLSINAHLYTTTTRLMGGESYHLSFRTWFTEFENVPSAQTSHSNLLAAEPATFANSPGLHEPCERHFFEFFAGVYLGNAASRCIES